MENNSCATDAVALSRAWEPRRHKPVIAEDGSKQVSLIQCCSGNEAECTLLLQNSRMEKCNETHKDLTNCMHRFVLRQCSGAVDAVPVAGNPGSSSSSVCYYYHEARWEDVKEQVSSVFTSIIKGGC